MPLLTPTLPAPLDLLRRLGRAHRCLRHYDRYYGRCKLRMDPMYRALAGRPEAWGSVLDVGCGPGMVAGLCAVRGDVSAYSGFDLDAKKLRAARRLLAHLRPADAQRWTLTESRLPLAGALPGMFDTAFALDVLHYWPVEIQRDILRQVRQAANPGATLYLREGLADEGGRTGVVGFAERLATLLGLNPRVRRLHFLTVAEMVALLREVGFAVEQVTRMGGINQLWRCRCAPPEAKGGVIGG